MNICIPITRDNGLQSPVSPHFGSAPIFVIVDMENGSYQAIANRNLHHHAHGTCQPLEQLEGQSVDAMVVGGIGMGALGKLKAAGIRVFFSEHPTVEKTVDALQAGRLREVTPATACVHRRNGSQEHAWEGSGQDDPHGPCEGSGEMGS
jgi:predicted Fe-Mo cluster-binding NifX family protein